MQLQRIFSYDLEKYETSNNVPISKFIIEKVNNILKNIDYNEIYNYPDIRRSEEIIKNIFNSELYFNFGVDAIIKDIFSIFNGKKIYFEEPNYGMVPVYSKLYNHTLTTIQEADIIYIANPNGMTCKKQNNEEILNLLKSTKSFVVLDLSYDVYTYNNFNEFVNFINETLKYNCIVLFGMSKILGLPSERVGIAVSNENSDIMKKLKLYSQPYQICAVSNILFQNLFKPEIINKHVNIIKNSKEFYIEKYSDVIEYNTDGPFLILNKEIDYKTKNVGNHYRFSIIDKNLKESNV
jgi:histidinol-phosphate/aromatic aminotransferase/cobyric acid decarboxylase-like protein